MKPLIRQLLLIWGLIATAAATPSVLKLNDGSVIKGEISPSSPTATEVVVTTEFGVIRVPVDKISPESRKAAGIGQPASAAQYEARIAQLEAKVRGLEAENASLRRAATAAPTARPQQFITQPTQGAEPASGLSYSRSSTGKRHNSRCRYYTPGNPCGPSDGVPCKICGG
jgi:hypothetical protein